MKEVEKILLTRGEIVALKEILDSVENPKNKPFCEKIKKLIEDTSHKKTSSDNILNLAEFRNQKSNIVQLVSYKNRKKF